MMDWVTNKTQNIVTYGRRNKPSTNLQSSSTSALNSDRSNVENLHPIKKPMMFDFSTVDENKLSFPNEEESTSGKRVKQERTGLKEIFETSSAFTKTKPTAKNLKKREETLKNAIKEGTLEDIDFLIHSIDEHNAGLSKTHSSTHFFLPHIAKFAAARKANLTKWLDSLGFQNNQFDTICLPINEIDVLFKLLKIHQALIVAVKATTSTPVSMRSKSSSSESLTYLDYEALHDSFITAEKLEDQDRRHKAAQKTLARKRSISNPVLLTINTGIDISMQPIPLVTSTSLQMINPSTMGSGSNSNGSRKYKNFIKRRSSGDAADDISERGAESPAWNDTFSPNNMGNRSRSGSCRNRSASPLEPSLLDSLRDKMTIVAGSIASSSTSHDENEDFSNSVTQQSQQFPSTVVTSNLFSTLKESALGLHSIEEDEEEQPATQLDDGHDSDAPTEIDEQEDDHHLHQDRMSCEDFAAHISPANDTSHSFFSPSCGTSRPPFDFGGRPSFPPEHHFNTDNGSGGRGHPFRSSSLFNASVEPVLRMPSLFLGGGAPHSPDDDLGNLSELRRSVGPPRADDTLLRNGRAQKKSVAQQTRLNQLCRSKTEPLAYSYSVNAVAEGTPVQDRSNYFSQPNPVVFNTPQAVFHAKWENSQAANPLCIQWMMLRIKNISGSTQTHSPYAEEQSNTACGISIRAGSGLRSARPSSEADFFSMGSVEHRSSLLGMSHSDEMPEYGAVMDHCPISSLVSSRPSFGPDESSRHPSMPPQSANPPTGFIATARMSLFKRVTSCNSSLSTMNDNAVNLTSPTHVLPTLSFQESPSPAVTANAEAKKQQMKLKKSACKQRRMSRIAVGRSTVNADKTFKAENVVARVLASTFSPCAKAKSGTSTRFRRRQSAALTKQRLDDSVVSEAPLFMVHDDEENEEQNQFPDFLEEAEDQFSVLNKTADTVRVDPHVDEQVFDGIVLGGSYQHCFEDGAPVVCAPGASDKRITDLQLSSTNGLVLSMFLPKDRAVKSVDLGRDWQVRRASPCGYLVSRGQSHLSGGMEGDESFLNESVQRRAQSVCYYFLAKHPSDWMISSLHKAPRDQRISLGAGPTHLNDRFSDEDALNCSMAMDEDPYMDVESQDDLFRQDSHDTASYNEFSAIRAPSRHRTLSLSKRGGLFLSDESMRSNTLTETEGMCSTEGGGDEFCFTQLTQMDATAMDSLCLEDDNDEEYLVEEAVVRSATSMHCLNASLMSLVLGYLVNGNPVQKTVSASNKVSRKNKRTTSDAEETVQLQTVCKAWALATYMLTAQRLSDFAAGRASALKYDKWSRFVSQYSWGKFLSQGVCKNVFCVQSPRGTLEAVSIMDVDDLADRDMEGAVTQELQISILCSALVSLHICPNLVQVYSMFQAEYAEPAMLWDGSARPTRPASPLTVTIPKKASLTRGNFQFIRMEFCSGGDAEELVRKNNQLAVQHVKQFLFQMCYALYTCREQISLRHFDIKLLNFFVTAGVDALSEDKRSPSLARGAVDMRVGFGQHVYGLTLRCDVMDLVKLADFGTSAVGHECLGDPITLQQFTTLENTPPEFLIIGSAARQCFSADTFSLGLCFLHLLTGFEPYEELLKDVRCPKYLTTRLQKIWRTDDIASPFHVVGQVLVSMDESADEQVQEDDGVQDADASRITEVLFDTLYRFTVLFGAGGAEDVYAGNPVWTALCESLGLGGEQTGRRVARGGKADSIAQYRRESDLWSVRTGQHPKMRSLRQRLADLGDGAAQLLESMTHFDPSMRCSMNEALHSPVFTSLRMDNALHTTTGKNVRTSKSKNAFTVDGGDVSYMHYYRGADEACDDLPIV